MDAGLWVLVGECQRTNGRLPDQETERILLGPEEPRREAVSTEAWTGAADPDWTFPNHRWVLLSDAGAWVSCKSQQVGKLEPRPMRFCCLQQPPLLGINALAGVCVCAGALVGPGHRGHLQGAAPRLHDLRLRVFSVGSLPEGGGRSRSACPEPARVGMVFVRFCATPAVAPGAALDAR